MKKVAFICVHNSCRSQMAEAFARVMGLGVFEAFSAGTELKSEINPDAAAVMREVGIDMTLHQKPKLISQIPVPDILITMGCGVVCPSLPGVGRIEDWALEDPSGLDMEKFRMTRDIIRHKVLKLSLELLSDNGELAKILEF